MQISKFMTPLDVCMTTNPRDMSAQDVAALFRQAL